MSEDIERRLEGLAKLPVTSPPSIEELRERERRRNARRARTAVGVAVVLVVLGVVALVQRGDERRPVVTDRPPRTTSTTAPDDDGADQVVVTDDTGAAVGTIDRSDADDRDERVAARLAAGFREPTGGNDQEYQRLAEALTILDPVLVVDDDGATVGYWVGRYLTRDEWVAARAEAQATVDELLDD